MVNHSYNSTSSKSSKRFSRHLVGDFTFALYRQKARQKLFLQRNITRVLASHRKRRQRELASADTHLNLTKQPRKQVDLSEEKPSETPARNGLEEGASLDGSETSANPLVISSQAQRQQATMATRSLPSQSNGAKNERSTRRSIRGLDRIYEETDAELTLDLSNIRKKLNFKTNSLDDSERPSKRQKRDTVRCQCHLTIWDNRDGFAVRPLTTKSSYCRVTATETMSNGYFVDLELEKPFVVKATELKVPVEIKQGAVTTSALGIIDKYFLEMKIIPCRADSRWPPIPILGKSDGDHFAHDIGKTGSELLQGAVVARYTHLPQAPEADVPLSVFFLHEGRTYRTKYGLQVISTWQKSRDTSKDITPGKYGLDLDSFKPERPNGIGLINGTKRETKPADLAKVNQPKVRYNFSPKLMQRREIDEEFRVATVKGYRCPLCTMDSSKLHNLQFHLSTMHSKYTFSVQRPRRDPLSNHLAEIEIKVDMAQPVKSPVQKKAEDEKDFMLQVPEGAFDLPAFADRNDRRWPDEAFGKKIIPKEPTPPTTYSSKRPASGFPSATEVPDFREPQRKKYRPIKLNTRYAQDEPIWTSVSHRPVSPSEELYSETDDEIDDDWRIELQMENLDLAAKVQGWSDEERELRKRWDRHRMEEREEHPFYLSNCLHRFVRKHRTWLSSGNDKLLLAFWEFLNQLEELKVIDDSVIAEVNQIISDDVPATTENPAATVMQTDRRSTERSGRASRSRTGTPRPQKQPAEPAQPQSQTRPQQQSKLAAYTCGLCGKKITKMHQNAILCADPECETSTSKYHKKCALESQHLRSENDQGRSQGKGKDREEPSQSMDKATSVQSWSCNTCVTRQRDRVKAKELEKERERQMVAKAAAAVVTAAMV